MNVTHRWCDLLSCSGASQPENSQKADKDEAFGEVHSEFVVAVKKRQGVGTVVEGNLHSFKGYLYTLFQRLARQSSF